MCTCDSNFNGDIRLPSSSGESNVEVRSGGSPIVVTTVIEGDKTIYYVSYQPYVAPKSTLVVNPSVIEVGQEVTAVFTGTYTQGSKALVSKTVSPTVVDVTSTPFNFEVLVNPLVKGPIASHTFTVSDDDTSVVSSASITVKNRFYTGFSSVDYIDSVDGFTSGLGLDIQDVFGGPRNYEVPNNNYIYWLTPYDWTPNLILDGFPFAIKKLGILGVNNPHGLLQTYNVWRSVNYFGASTLTIDMK